jgi:predicted LPLAT superfamily acyltransferase
MARAWWRRFAVRGIFWRRYLDFGVTNVPFYLVPMTVFFWTIFFYFVAASARRAVISNLRVIRPQSFRVANYFRAWLTFYNFAWTIVDAADFKIAGTEFVYEVEGEQFLEQLATAHGAILLTAHMGSYDLGAALFARRYSREIRMVRVPEVHEETGQHLDESLERSGAGAVKVAYKTSTLELPLELLSALRAGEIVSIQGDRPVPDSSSRVTNLLGQKVSLPDGPFILSFVAQAPIFPVFIVRTSYHHYKIIAPGRIECQRDENSREVIISRALKDWTDTLAEMIQRYWAQWFSFVPIFPER